MARGDPVNHTFSKVSPGACKTVNLRPNDAWEVSAYAPTDRAHLCYDDGNNKGRVKSCAHDPNESTTDLSSRPVFNDSIKPGIFNNTKSSIGAYIGGEER